MEPSPDNLTAPTTPGYEEDVAGRFPVAVAAVIGLAASLLILLTTLGNSFTLVVFARRKSLRKFGDFFIINLAIADLAIGVMCIPPYVPYLLTGSWQGGQAYCKFWLLWDYTTPAASTFCICIISLDRYLLVVHPLLYRRVQSKRLLVVMLVSPWSVSFLLYGSSILLWEVRFGVKIAQGACYVPFFDDFPFLLFTSFMEFILPFTIMAVANVLLFLSIRSRLSSKIAHSSRLCVNTAPGPGPPESGSRHAMTSEQRGPDSVSSSRFDAQPSQPERTRGCQVLRISEELNVAKDDFKVAGENTKERSKEEVGVQVHSIEPRREGNQHSGTDGALTVASNTGNASFLDFRTCNPFRVESSTGNVHTVNPKVGSASTNEPRRTNVFTVEPRTRNFLAVDSRTASACTPEARTASVPTRVSRTGNGASAAAPSSVTSLSRRRPGKDLRVARSLFVLVIVFAVCWMPYEVMAIINASCRDCVIPDIFEVAFWLLWLNSTLNPVLYPILHKRFREAAASVVKEWCAREQRGSRAPTR